MLPIRSDSLALIAMAFAQALGPSSKHDRRERLQPIVLLPR